MRASMPKMPSLNRISSAYHDLSRESYLTVACIQSGLLRSGSDAASQMIRGVEFCPYQSLAMGTIGVLCSGLVGAQWLRHLESQMGSGTSTRDIVKKSAADYFCYAPCANSCYLFFVPLLTAAFAGDSTGALLDGWTPEGFRAVMMLEACTFTPYNLCAFKLVPPHMRPLAAAAVSATCTIVLSAITLM